MKGVLLAGGKGTRLYPLTAVTNKHLVSIGNLPMIEYPIHTLKQLGVDSINVVTGGEHFDAITRYLGTMHPELDFSFHYQKEAGGIAQALFLTENFIRDDKIAVILGDNIIEKDIKKPVQDFIKQQKGARILLKKVEDPERFGVVEFSSESGKGKKIVSIEEKPKNPKSDYAVTGIYMYDSQVFEIIKRLKPSGRGELEITDVNNAYLERGELEYSMLEGWWTDSGTFESLLNANMLVAKKCHV